MELDSILAEARTRRMGSSAPSNAPKRPDVTPRQEAPRQASVAPSRQLNDDFIVVDDGRADAPYQGRPEKNPRPSYDYDDYDAPRPKKKKKTGLIVALCIIGIVLIAGLAAFGLYMFSGSGTGPESTFSDNVYVNGKSLKDLTMDEAKTMMKSVEDELAAGIKVEVKAGDKTYTYTKNDFKYSFDTESVLNEAKAYSEEKGIKTEDKNYEIKMTVEFIKNQQEAEYHNEILSMVSPGTAAGGGVWLASRQLWPFCSRSDSMFTISVRLRQSSTRTLIPTRRLHTTRPNWCSPKWPTT